MALVGTTYGCMLVQSKGSRNGYETFKVLFVRGKP